MPLFVAGATLGGALCLPSLLALWLGRAAAAAAAAGLAAASFAARRRRSTWRAPRIAAQAALAARPRRPSPPPTSPTTTAPRSSTALPPALYDVLEPDTRNATIAILKSKVVADDDAPRPHRARRPRLPLAQRQPHAQPGEHAGLQPPCGSRSTAPATGAEDHVGLPDQRKFSPLFPSYRSTLANLLGLRFIVTGAPIESIDRSLKPGDLPLVARTSDGYIYENPDASPRVLFATAGPRRRFRPHAARRRLARRRPRTTVLLENAPRRPRATPRRPGSARIASYRNTEVVLEADSPDGGWVVLNDLWHPWWFAEVDGRPAAILRANVLFRAVAVPPGRHTVRFRFRPIAGAWAIFTNPPAAFQRQP